MFNHERDKIVDKPEIKTRITSLFLNIAIIEPTQIKNGCLILCVSYVILAEKFHGMGKNLVIP